MSRRLLAVAVAVVTVSVVSACGGGGRGEARDELVDQLVEGGLERPVAECVVGQFFDNHTDAELKAFFDRDELTDAERAEFASLGRGCAPD
jgi:hypothetical protein